MLELVLSLDFCQLGANSADFFTSIHGIFKVFERLATPIVSPCFSGEHNVSSSFISIGLINFPDIIQSVDFKALIL